MSDPAEADGIGDALSLSGVQSEARHASSAPPRHARYKLTDYQNFSDTFFGVDTAVSPRPDTLDTLVSPCPGEGPGVRGQSPREENFGRSRPQKWPFFNAVSQGRDQTPAIDIEIFVLASTGAGSGA